MLMIWPLHVVVTCWVQGRGGKFGAKVKPKDRREEGEKGARKAYRIRGDRVETKIFHRCKTFIYQSFFSPYKNQVHKNINSKNSYRLCYSEC